LLGLPNAGKSTLISSISAARPKIADYPFTTLYPNLGVIYCGNQRSFVMADIPGLIEGAADGAGLGIRFLKHLQRTRVLLHLVDILPLDPAADPVRDARSIVGELGKFSEDLLAKPRWLVLNKSDLLPEEEARAKATAIAQALKYRGPAFLISGVAKTGTSDLIEAVMRFIETGEAPAQGNLPLPVVVERKPAAARGKAVPARKQAATAANKLAAKKPAATKPVAKKPTAKKSAAKKSASKKAAAQKAAAKGAPARKPAKARAKIAAKGQAKRPAKAKAQRPAKASTKARKQKTRR
jgi:Fe2+ transport system protein B